MSFNHVLHQKSSYIYLYIFSDYFSQTPFWTFLNDTKYVFRPFCRAGSRDHYSLWVYVYLYSSQIYSFPYILAFSMYVILYFTITYIVLYIVLSIYHYIFIYSIHLIVYSISIYMFLCAREHLAQNIVFLDIYIYLYYIYFPLCIFLQKYFYV